MLEAQIKNRVLVGKVNNHISGKLKNIEMIKSFSKESYMEENYKTYLIDNYKTMEKVNFYDSIFSPIIMIIRAIIIAVVVILSSKELGYLGISLGMVAASIELISNLFSPIQDLGMELQSIQKGLYQEYIGLMNFIMSQKMIIRTVNFLPNQLYQIWEEEEYPLMILAFTMKKKETFYKI